MGGQTEAHRNTHRKANRQTNTQRCTQIGRHTVSHTSANYVVPSSPTRRHNQRYSGERQQNTSQSTKPFQDPELIHVIRSQRRLPKVGLQLEERDPGCQVVRSRSLRLHGLLAAPSHTKLRYSIRRQHVCTMCHVCGHSQPPKLRRQSNSLRLFQLQVLGRFPTHVPAEGSHSRNAYRLSVYDGQGSALTKTCYPTKTFI